MFWMVFCGSKQAALKKIAPIFRGLLTRELSILLVYDCGVINSAMGSEFSMLMISRLLSVLVRTRNGEMDKLKPIARYALLGIATVLGWLVIAANGASWGLARLQAAAQIRAELLR